MSLFGAVTTGTSAAQAQSNVISIISSNISNSSTTGYKAETVSFSDLVSDYSANGYSSNGSSSVNGYVQSGVTTGVLQLNTSPGTISSTSTSTNLAISGSGFFAVNQSTSSSSDSTVYTRDGSFSKDANGNLVNSEGYYLQGYALDSSGAVTSTALQTVNIPQTDAASGTLTEVSTSSSGVVQATYSDGTTSNLYAIPLANFSEPAKLQSLSGGAYSPTTNSGAANFSLAGQNGVGTIKSSSLEASNADITSQLTNLVSAQNAYEASSKLISASDDMLTNLISMGTT
jgi:flagellar hook protein FlgE